MKTRSYLPHFLFPALIAAPALLLLSGCESTGGTSNPSGLSTEFDSPMKKQMRMQEAQSRVTRSLIP